MKLTLSFRGLKAHPKWQGLIEAQLKRLQALASIASARVTLEWQRDRKPPFCVGTLLEVPGPDFHAQAKDHTLPAALLKAVKDLERQIRSRNARRAERHKTNPQLGLAPSRAALAIGRHG